MVRLAKESDLITIAELLYQVHKVHNLIRPDLFIAKGVKYKYDDLIKLYNDSRYHMFVACKGEYVVGYAICIDNVLETNLLNLYIDDLCVDEKYRHQGYGKSIYSFIIDYAKNNNYHNVNLNVYYDNKEAYKFYESLGMNIQKVYFEKILTD